MSKIFIATDLTYSNRHGNGGGHLTQAAFHTREDAIEWLEANSDLFLNDDGDYNPSWDGDHAVDLNDEANDRFLAMITVIDTDNLGSVFIDVDET